MVATSISSASSLSVFSYHRWACSEAMRLEMKCILDGCRRDRHCHCFNTQHNYYRNWYLLMVLIYVLLIMHCTYVSVYASQWPMQPSRYSKLHLHYCVDYVYASASPPAFMQIDYLIFQYKIFSIYSSSSYLILCFVHMPMIFSFDWWNSHSDIRTNIIFHQIRYFILMIIVWLCINGMRDGIWMLKIYCIYSRQTFFDDKTNCIDYYLWLNENAMLIQCLANKQSNKYFFNHYCSHCGTLISKL